MPQSARDRRQQRCGYHACGKLGHATSKCWVAHPELRPQPHKNSRQGRQSLKLPKEPKRASQQSVPFRLLDLPGEVRNQIYEEVYGEPYDMTATLPIGPLRSDKGRFRLIMSQPNLHLASKEMYQETCLARSRRVFGGHLRCQYGPIPRLNSELKYAPLRNSVNKITFFGCNHSNMNGITFPNYHWHGIEEAFPNLQVIHIEWTQKKQKYSRHSETGYSDGWTKLQDEGTLQSFLDGDFDPRFHPDFNRPIERLKVPFLVFNMNPTRNVAVFVTTTLQWLGNGDECPFQQKVKFFFGRSAGLRIVERTTEGNLTEA